MEGTNGICQFVVFDNLSSGWYPALRCRAAAVENVVSLPHIAWILLAGGAVLFWFYDGFGHNRLFSLADDAVF